MNDLSNSEATVFGGLLERYSPSSDRKIVKIAILNGWIFESFKELWAFLQPAFRDLWTVHVRDLFSPEAIAIQSTRELGFGRNPSLHQLWDEIWPDDIRLEWPYPSSLFVLDFIILVSRIRTKIVDSQFFQVVFALLRMPPKSVQVRDACVALRREICGTVLGHSLDETTSILRHFVVLFGSQFHVSRGIVANMFADSLLVAGDPVWRYGSQDFPRSVSVGGLFVTFSTKEAPGLNGGVKIVWNDGRLKRTFYSKVPRTTDANNFWASFRNKSDRFLDFRELVSDILLEALGFGPRVVFVVDGYAPGSLYILTQAIEKVWFPGKRSMERDRKFAKLYAQRSDECLQLVLLVKLLGLANCHGGNICFCSDRDKPPLRIIDFIVMDMKNKLQAFICRRTVASSTREMSCGKICIVLHGAICGRGHTTEKVTRRPFNKRSSKPYQTVVELIPNGRFDCEKG
jgi:hypothetical protein